MELRQLKSFVAVAERLSFIQAARHLNLSQPALSTQIQVLEASVGVQLFDRNRRSVRLTAAGEVFWRDAQNILRMSESAQASAQRVAAGEEGRLRVGFVASAALDLVPSIVLAFRKRHPHVRLELLNIRTTAQMAALEERSIDVGYLRLPASGKGLSITPIHRERLVVVLPVGCGPTKGARARESPLVSSDGSAARIVRRLRTPLGARFLRPLGRHLHAHRF